MQMFTLSNNGGPGASTVSRVSTSDATIPEAANGANQNFTIGATPAYDHALVFLGTTLQTSGYSFAAGQVQFVAAPTIGMAPLTVCYWS